jgi:hypothetical protein
MPPALLGAVAVGATCGWLCGIMLAPLRPDWRAELIVLVTLLLMTVPLFWAFGPRAALGFGISTGFFYFIHAAWRIRFIVRRNI